MSLEEIQVQASCGAVGRTIGELDVARSHRARTSSRFARLAARLEVRPTNETLLEENDVIVGDRLARGDPEARATVRAAGHRWLAPRGRAARRSGSARRSAPRSSSSGRRTPRTATSRRTSRFAPRRRWRARRASSREESRRSVELLDEVDVAPRSPGPGFINLRVGDAFFLAALAEVGDGYGGGLAEPAERVQVEMVSANPTGPIVVSAARNGAYGDCVARLLEFAGHDVAREYYYNDAGAQMDRFRASIEALRRGEQVAEDGYRGDVRRRARREPRAIRFRRCSRRSSTRWSASASTSTAGRCRASSSCACPSSCRGSTPTRRTARSGRARPPTATSRTG